MWKVKQSLTRLTGKFTFKHFRWVCCLCCFLLCRTADAAPVTNVDFVVVYGRWDRNMVDPEPWQTKYNSYPVGRLLFWTVIFDDVQTRGEIYRSESGHIGFIKQVAGGEVFVMANESGGPASWLLDTSTIHVGWGSHTWYARPPHVWRKSFYDIFATVGVGNRGGLYNSTDGVISDNYTLLGIVGDVGFLWRNFVHNGQTYSAVCPSVRHDYYGYIDYHVHVPFSYYSVYATWRSPLFDVPIDIFKMHLDSKWWIRGQFAVDSTGITGIGYGTGDQGESGQTASGSSGGGGGITTLPGAIDDPPQTPLGLNGRWVYDPETKLWNWVGDIADNASQINPYDNSVMPENQERGLAQEATLRQVKAGIDGLAKENTLQQIRMTLEEFQKTQGITSEQLQAMIDNAVIEIVDGQVQYWEGKNIPQAIASVGDQAAQSVGAAANQIENKLENIGDRIVSAVGARGGIALRIVDAQDELSGKLDSLGSRVDSGSGAIVDAIDAINDITIPENPTVEGQETESYEITAPDLSSQIDGWFTFDFPRLTIARQFVFEDYDIGVFGWKIPFSAFNNSSIRIMINTVRNILAWLVYLSAGLGVFKAMGGGGV